MSSINRQGSINKRDFLKGSSAVMAGMVAGCIGTEPPEGEPSQVDTDTTDEADTDTTDEDEDEFPEREVEFVVPYGPGGGFGVLGLAIGEFWPEYLGADVVVNNVEGAGGRRGANEVYRADPDGYTVGWMNIPGFISSQIIEGTEYDVGEMSHVARAASEQYVIGVRPGFASSLDDLLEHGTLREATPGLAGTGALVAVIASDTMGMDIEFVTGYDDAAETVAAILRGDAEFRYFAVPTAQPFVEDGDIEIALAISDEPPDYAPDAQTVVDAGYPELADLGLHRVISGPPGVPNERVEHLEQTIIEAIESDEFQSWANENNVTLNPARSEEIEGIIEESMELFHENQELLEETLGSD